MAITFDDGYADNHDVALPVLRKHGLTATFFVATGFLDGGRMWNDSVIEALRRCPRARLDLSGTVAASMGALELGDDASRRKAVEVALGAIKYLGPEQRARWVEAIVARAGVKLPDDLMMTSDQVRALHREGMSIGGHTVTHPILRGMPQDRVHAEIEDGRRELKGILGCPIDLFAYPNGRPGVDYDESTVQVLRELGLKVAVTTEWRAAVPGDDPLLLPRYMPWERTQSGFAFRMCMTLAQSRNRNRTLPPLPSGDGAACLGGRH
jgi:peptidoglycan/xylan/chitin deacetylase (PgdA/CDA1 family)